MLLLESIWIWFWVKAFAFWMGMLFFKFKWVYFSLRACLEYTTRTVIQNYTLNSIYVRFGIDQHLNFDVWKKQRIQV